MNLVSRIFQRCARQKGQSIVEISLITPLLLLALCVPADFGIAFFVGNMVATAARDGARIGSGLAKPAAGGDEQYTSAMATTVKNGTFALMPTASNPRIAARRVRVTFYEGTAVPQDCMEVIEVTAEVDYNFFLYQILNLFGGSIQNPVTIARTTQMRYNYQPFNNTAICAQKSVDDLLYTS
jgi:Flp pilus assembly protein TadG